jgi:chaperonin GroEL
MLEGVNRLADAVQTTLGPRGRNVAIEQVYGGPKITKDGVTVAKSIEFADRYQNMGAQLVRQVASKTNDKAGDGTTTATVLARAIYVEGVKAVAAGMNPMDIRKGITAAVEDVLATLKKQTRPVKVKEEIAQVATISANGDREMGELIAAAMDRVGKEGVITVQEGKTLHDELDVVEGLRIDRGFISPYFVNNRKTQRVEYENALLLLVEGKVTNVQDILPILEEVVQGGRPLIIMAEDIEGEALAALLLNFIRGSARLAAVKAPGFGDNRKKMLQDIAVLTGATVVSEDMGMKLNEARSDVLGSCAKINISKDETIVLDGAGQKAAIEARCEELRAALAEPSLSDYEREKLQERLAKLSGGVAVIKVGGVSEVEVGEKKDRLDDALNATRAAIEEGIVPGGGSALLYATQKLGAVRSAMVNYDQKVGVDIIQRALQVPSKSIVNNAGLDGAVVIGKLLDLSAGDIMSTNGIDFRVGDSDDKYKIVDMFEAGIIDPTKVVRCALTDASGVASLMTTTEAVIVDAPKPPAPAMAAAPQMGGMGGMGGGMF